MRSKGSLAKRLVRAVKAGHAALRRRRFSGTFVAVTGSSGKSTTTALLAHILEAHGPTGSQRGYNTIDAVSPALRKLPVDLHYVVCETGVAAIGDMAPMAWLLRPDIAIVTLVNKEHYKAFRGVDGVSREKGQLVESLRATGLAILNAEDEHVMAMARRSRGRVVTIGRSEGCDYRARITSASSDGGMVLDISWHGGDLRLRTRFLADHFWVACTAATAAAIELGVPPETIAERIAGFEGLSGRFEMFATQSGPRFVLDTLKAPADSLATCFEAFGRLEAPFKRVVLGQISDYAGKAKREYRNAYRAAAEVCDQVIFVGENSHRSRASEADRQSGRFLAFEDWQSAHRYLRENAGADDLILLKSSVNLHLERIALAWDNEVKCLEAQCGARIGCRACGLYGHPFAEHPRLKAAIRRSKRKEMTARVGGHAKSAPRSPLSREPGC